MKSEIINNYFQSISINLYLNVAEYGWLNVQACKVPNRWKVSSFISYFLTHLSSNSLCLVCVLYCLSAALANHRRINVSPRRRAVEEKTTNTNYLQLIKVSTDSRYTSHLWTNGKTRNWFQVSNLISPFHLLTIWAHSSVSPFIRGAINDQMKVICLLLLTPGWVCI